MPSVLEQSNCGDDLLNLDQDDVFGVQIMQSHSKSAGKHYQ